MEKTTGNTPPKIEHLVRERLPCDCSLFDRWSGRWSGWVPAMTPRKNHDDFKRRATTKTDRPGYKMKKKTLKRCFKSTFRCGIYEWKAKRAETEHVVYIGSTCRNKNGDFIDRIYQYCTNGSHKSDCIDDALRKGYQLWVRFKGSGVDCKCNARNKSSAEGDENLVLMYFDYAWNIRTVKQIKRTVPR